MNILSVPKNRHTTLGSVVFFLRKRIQDSFKARSYTATVKELSRMPESMLKDIGMDHSNVGSKTYESIYGNK